MGNKVSTSGNDASAECAKVANSFAPAFLRAYSIALVAELRRQSELEGATNLSRSDIAAQYALERPPVATEPLEAGFLTKLGEIKKSWRRRYFVIAEESENFRLSYYEKETDAANNDARKAKGSIYLAGYVPRALSSDEGFGEHVLSLEPLNKRDKRTYYLRCDSEEQRQRWKLVLRLAALKAQPPLSPEPALAEAFRQAYARTRRSVGLAGYYALDRPEQEQLTTLCLEACRARLGPLLGAGGDAGALAPSAVLTAGGGVVLPSGDVLPPAEASSSASSSASSTVSATGPARSGGAKAGGASSSGGGGGGLAAKEREAVEREVLRIAGEAAATTWAAVTARVELRRDVLQRRASEGLPDIARADEELRQRLRGSVGPYVGPLAASTSSPLLPTLLGALCVPLYKAYKETVRVFFGRAQDILRRGLRERELRSFYRDARCQDGALGPALRKLRALTRGEVDEDDSGDATMALLSQLPVPLSDLRELLAGEATTTPSSGSSATPGSPAYTLWEIEVLVEDSLRQLLGWAIYSFVAAVERSRGNTTPARCLLGVTRDMLHDAKLRLRDNVGAVCRRVLAPRLRSAALALPPVRDALASTSELHGKPSFAVVGSTPAGGKGGSDGGGSAVAAVKVTKKAKVAAESEVLEARVSDLFCDGDWALDELLGDAVDAAVRPALDGRMGELDARLDKLMGKLGLDGSAAAAVGASGGGAGAQPVR